ncbi:metallophosphoesterase [Desulfobacterales bacterium HSG2]|nr:metallophosphoesterase [Desulfobacterales bacterium HSG2]
MRIYATADIHGRKKRITLIRNNIFKHKPDVLVIAGDISSCIRSARIIAQLNDMPVPVLAIRGNTDLAGMDRLMEEYPNISSLHLREVAVNGVCFTGVSGTIPLPFHSRIGFREQSVMKKLEPLVKRYSVLLAHPPPYRVLDEVIGRFHAGSRRLHELVLTRQPALLICGHIHERRGSAFVGKTLVVNCSMGRTGAGAIITFDPNREIKVEML